MKRIALWEIHASSRGFGQTSDFTISVLQSTLDSHQHSEVTAHARRQMHADDTDKLTVFTASTIILLDALTVRVVSDSPNTSAALVAAVLR
jgi:hypothetical protein